VDALRDELADLVADFLEYVGAMRASGTSSIPMAPAGAVAPTPSPGPAGHLLTRGAPTEGARSPPSPGPAGHPLPRGGRGEGGPVVPGDPPGGRALLGAWSKFLVDPAEELERTLAAFGASCPSCGAPAPRGEGSTRPRLFLVASPVTGAAAEMLAAMLVKVLNVEPTDTYRVSPVGCGTCRKQVGAIAAALRARVILGLGADARSMMAAPPGEWAAWEGAEVLGSYHPSEMLADRGLKRPTFEHLQALAQRLAR
jgi:uracil-DNA glycosylase